MKKIPSRISRRQFLLGSAAVIGAMSTSWAPSAFSANRSIKVGVFGGYFEDAFNQHIFPEFTKATGIAVESVGQPASDAWLLQQQQAAKAGVVVADVSMMGRVNSVRGVRQGIWKKLDPTKMPNIAEINSDYLETDAKGELYGVGAVNWWVTLVSNTEAFPVEPNSWKEFWKPENKNKLGLAVLANNSFLLEICAKTFYDGYDILNTEKGILEVMKKLAELKPNVALWYRDEGQFQQALQSGEVPMGEYYHDVTTLAINDGFPVRSTFPVEGGVSDGGNWTSINISKKIEEVHSFIDFMAAPSTQDLLARKVGVAPIVPRSKLSLTDEEFAAVSSEKPPVLPQYALHLEKGDWIEQKWTEIVTS